NTAHALSLNHSHLSRHCAATSQRLIGAPQARPPERPAFARALRRGRRSFSGGGSGAGGPASGGGGGRGGEAPRTVIGAARAAAISATLDDLARRVTAVDDHTKRLDDVGTRITALEELARQADQTALKAAGPDGELHKYREAVQQLSSQALQTQATLETLKKERDALEELRGELHTVDGEAKQSLAQSATIRTDLDQIRALAARSEERRVGK